MTYLEVVTDICSRVNDPELDAHKERAKDHFLRAIATKINNNEFTENDIAGFVKLKTDVDFGDAGDTENLNALKVFKILDLFTPPGTDKDVIITFQETDQLNKISMLETLQPSKYDLFIYLVGNTLYAYTGSTPNFALGVDNLYMKYIADINDDGWVDSTDFQGASSFIMTSTFMRACIDIASETLLKEIQL